MSADWVKPSVNLQLSPNQSCIIISSLQHEHTQPSLVGQARITIFFLLVATLGVLSSSYPTPNNLLFAISGSKLGFTAGRGYLTYICYYTLPLRSQSFSFLTSNFEPSSSEVKEVNNIETPAPEHISSISYGNLDKDNKNNCDEQLDAYKAPGAYLKASLLRIAIIGICVIIAVIWRDKLNPLVNFIGASANATVNMIFPILFCLKAFWTTISKFIKAGGILCILIALFLGIYVAIQTGKYLFTPTKSTKLASGSSRRSRRGPRVVPSPGLGVAEHGGHCQRLRAMGRLRRHVPPKDAAPTQVAGRASQVQVHAQLHPSGTEHASSAVAADPRTTALVQPVSPRR
ncbi:hypothetical protein THRCLA_03856 [Thraustotheca clavata]|uniref:Amino acid transporter transmembrane domain-containing protein n=1 Tax=Thraustotheca clavata TaxID=74557 RepID=A0A1W0A0R9_9STRA|nr:hypothetical protein THRCLA_03856 [Thraustotheca clavata]